MNIRWNCIYSHTMRAIAKRKSKTKKKAKTRKLNNPINVSVQHTKKTKSMPKKSIYNYIIRIISQQKELY